MKSFIGVLALIAFFSGCSVQAERADVTIHNQSLVMIAVKLPNRQYVPIGPGNHVKIVNFEPLDKQTMLMAFADLDDPEAFDLVEGNYPVEPNRFIVKYFFFDTTGDVTGAPLFNPPNHKIKVVAISINRSSSGALKMNQALDGRTIDDVEFHYSSEE